MKIKRIIKNETEFRSPLWLTPELIEEVKQIFEPRYKRPLTELEVAAIAENLTGLLEVFFKFKFRTSSNT